MSSMGQVGGTRGPVEIDTHVQTAAPAAAASSAAAAPAGLGLGAKGEDVKSAQKLLAAAGQPCTADGIFGRGTERAVIAFQTAKGLPKTGRLDEATMAALKPKPATTQTAATTPATQTGAGAIPKDRLVTSFKLDAEMPGTGPLTAKIGGKDKVLDENAAQAWQLEGGRFLAWDGGQGSGVGGFEGEGEGLKLYDAKTGQVTSVLAEDVMIEDVKSVKLPDGRSALLVAMRDGGLGAPHLAIVDPERGQVASLGRAEAGALKGGVLTIKEHGNEDDIDKVTGTRTIDLAKVLSGPVIAQPRQLWDAEQAGDTLARSLASGDKLSTANTLLGVAELPKATGDKDWVNDQKKMFQDSVAHMAKLGILDDVARTLKGAKLPGDAGAAFSAAIAKYGTPATKQAWDKATIEANR